MTEDRRSGKSGMWLGFGFVTGSSIGLCIDPRSIPFFAALGMITTALVSSYLK